MTIVYGDPESFYKKFLKFAARSQYVVEYEGREYHIEHTQFAGYPVQELFTELADGLSFDITEEDEIGKMENISIVQEELVEALRQTQAHVSFELQKLYHKREYVKERDLEKAISDYMMSFSEKTEDSSIYPFTPQAETKYEAIAEILTLVNSEEASIMSDFSSTGFTDKDDKSKPDPGTDTLEAFVSIQNTIISNHGFSVLTRPDPSLSTIREVFTLYQEVGINPSVRDVYGVFVKDYMVQPSTRDFITDTARGGGDLTRWTSENEPSLTTLDSYGGG